MKEKNISCESEFKNLEEMASLNKKEKVVYDAPVRKLNETRKTLVKVEATHASASNDAASQQREHINNPLLGWAIRVAELANENISYQSFMTVRRRSLYVRKKEIGFEFPVPTSEKKTNI
ncbi:hypothetical protein E3N88_28784 [Mikania micrantha]|uniref:Uncharacterized protein n=1 Tax=Mikania micrantha TaxID=192012 RepID=A0A5N6N0G0_9ASTR|nr:hypothetical protein E3N88_28784 [Mikania micrantha]